MGQPDTNMHDKETGQQGNQENQQGGQPGGQGTQPAKQAPGYDDTATRREPDPETGDVNQQDDPAWRPADDPSGQRRDGETGETENYPGTGGNSESPDSDKGSGPM